jgi:hypothetical protein
MIHVSSKLIDAIKAHAPDGDRFAIAEGAMTVLTPKSGGPLRPEQREFL